MKTSELDELPYRTMGNIEFDACPVCKSKYFKKEDLGGCWAFEITCDGCGSIFILSHGDKMGGQEDYIDFKQKNPYKPLTDTIVNFFKKLYSDVSK